MTRTDQLREFFKIDESMVSTFEDTEAATARWKEQTKNQGLQFHPAPGTVTEELWLWKEYARSHGLRFDVEYLLPRIRQAIEGEWPQFTRRRRGYLDLSAQELDATVRELRPWTIPYQLADGVNTGQLPDSPASQRRRGTPALQA